MFPLLPLFPATANTHHSGNTDAFQIVRVPPPPGFYLVLLLTIALVAAWGMYVERRFRKCKCDEKPTILKPKWKKYEEEDE